MEWGHYYQLLVKQEEAKVFFLALVTTALWKVKGAHQWRKTQKLSLALVNKRVMHHDKKGVLIAWEGQLLFGNQSISN